MIVIAGGIGSGKSVVARILRLKGYGVFDCDYEAKSLMESDNMVKTEIADIAGRDIYDIQGRLRRDLLAQRLFSEVHLREKINRCVHRAVRERIASWAKESEKNIFVETAIAAESRLAEMASSIWVVRASEKVRVERVKERDGRNLEQIFRIIRAQENEENNLLSSGIPIDIIENNPGDDLTKQLDSLLAAI